jgi:hypothetical protein
VYFPPPADVLKHKAKNKDPEDEHGGSATASLGSRGGFTEKVFQRSRAGTISINVHK